MLKGFYHLTLPRHLKRTITLSVTQLVEINRVVRNGAFRFAGR